ncbi:hypothetical protein Q31a_30030 [Aureliella helgolandensis]|uniref:Uncharacterized protein n=1 Tax=Aureliella helgolandensis TaxID=2527968 RepID=A0A518G7X9_9BACT|nr:hypothetical protein Q31a_30030 [Aureliella helgolandensis]
MLKSTLNRVGATPRTWSALSIVVFSRFGNGARPSSAVRLAFEQDSRLHHCDVRGIEGAASVVQLEATEFPPVHSRKTYRLRRWQFLQILLVVVSYQAYTVVYRRVVAAKHGLSYWETDFQQLKCIRSYPQRCGVFKLSIHGRRLFDPRDLGNRFRPNRVNLQAQIGRNVFQL